MGQIITFYSYKGGVGRSMALANVAVVLSHWGYKTLLVDWDLEAPGLENFFQPYLEINQIAKKAGLLDYLIASQAKQKALDWSEYVHPIKTPLSEEPIHLISAGRRDDSYFQRLRSFDVSDFYENHKGGKIIEDLRSSWKASYDFVLIDSRTGVTDVGGICTIQLPDLLVLLFTPTEQGLNGIKSIADSAKKSRQKLPNPRTQLLILPIPTRIDANTEFKISEEWTQRFAEELSPYFDSWLHVSIPKKRMIERIKIPYIPYFSYGEKLPVIEQGTDDRAGLGYAYENMAALIARNLDDSLTFTEDRDQYIQLAGGQKKRTDRTGHEEASQPESAIRIFISYSRADVEWKNKLLLHLTPLIRSRQGVELWQDENILPGMDWAKEVMIHLERADIILFLVSPDSIASDFSQKEISFAMRNQKLVIPIFVRPALLEGSLISNIQGLPKGGALSSFSDESAAFMEIASELRKVIVYLQDQKRSPVA